VSTLSDLATQTFQRLEEPTPTFWSQSLEVLPYLVEALNEACLITGEPQVRQSTVFTLAAATTFFNVPSNCVALLRMEGPGHVHKTDWWTMDKMNPGWQGATGYGLGPYGIGPYGGTVRGDIPQFWGAFGLSQFFIYPALRAPVNVILTFVGLPITTGPPYTGSEPVDLQEELRESLVDYAVHTASLKEATTEFYDSIRVYDRFLQKMQEFSWFAERKAKLRFSRSLGSTAHGNPTEVK